MDTNEATNNKVETEDNRNAANENLHILKDLLTHKTDRVREYEKVKKNIQELIISESAPENFKSLIQLILKGETSIVKVFFEQEWQNLTSENKDLAIKELLALSAEKGTTRQAAVAQSIGLKDSDTAAKIIFHIIVGNKQNPSDYIFSSISKDKMDALRFRFFTQNGRWIPLNSSDKHVFRILVLFFSELAEQVKDFGKRSKEKTGIRLEIEFVEWIKDSLEKLNFDSEHFDKIETRLNRLVNSLPKLVQEQFKQSDKKLPIKLVETEINFPESDDQSKTIPSQNTFVDLSEKMSVQNDVQIKRAEPESVESKKQDPKMTEPAHKKITQKFSDLTTPEQLLKEKQNAVSLLSLEIEVLAKLINERDSLLIEKKSLKNRLYSAQDETEKLEKRLNDLRKKFDENEDMLTQVTNERDKAISFQKQLGKELSETKEQLEKANKSLESERSEFAQSSKQEVGFEIDSFKGDLKQKLRPIFENKRQTDDFPNDETLAEFLRDWFTQIEMVLNKSGINP